MTIVQKLLKPAFTQKELLCVVPVNKAIPIMSVPAMIGVLMILFTTMISTFYVGLLGDSDALVAVGVVYPVSLLYTTIAMILGAGLAASMGRYLGANRIEDSNRYASTMFALCLTVSILFTLAGIIFFRPLFQTLGADNNVIEYASSYFMITFVSSFFAILAQFINYIASAEGNMKLGMVAFISNSVIQVTLMPILIFILNMNLLGAAIASLIAQFACFTIMILPYIQKKMLVSLSVNNIVRQKGMVPQVIKSGLPLGLTQILMAFSIAITNITGKWLLKSTGADFIAGYGIAVKIMVMVQYLVISYMIGYQAIAAYSYGAKNKQRFWEAYNHARKVILACGITVAVLFSGLSLPLAHLFTSDPEIIQYAFFMMVSLALSLVVSFPLPAIITTYQATGKGGKGTLISSLRQGIVYIPLVLILPHLFSVWGFYLLQPLSDIISVTIVIFLFRKSRKKIDNELVT